MGSPEKYQDSSGSEKETAAYNRAIQDFGMVTMSFIAACKAAPRQVQIFTLVAIACLCGYAIAKI